MIKDCKTGSLVFVFAFAFIFGIMQNAIQGDDQPSQGISHGPNESFPVLMVQLSNVNSGSAAVGEAALAAYSGQSSRWARASLRQFFRLPGQLQADPPRPRGFAYFWNPTTPEMPYLGEFWGLLPGEVIDPQIVPVAGTGEPGDGEFGVEVIAPDRWALNYFATEPAGKKWVRVEPAVYSNYFARNQQSLWQSSSPALLNALLPEMLTADAGTPRLDVWLQTNEVPESLRDQWRALSSRAFAASAQKRDDESPATYRIRHLKEKCLYQLFELLTSADSKIHGSVEIAEDGSTKSRLQLSADKSPLITETSRMGAGSNRLNAVVQSHAPWLHGWLGIRLPDSLRGEIRSVVEEMEDEPAFVSAEILPLLRVLKDSEEFQIAVAGITEPEGSPALVLGVWSKGVSSLQGNAEKQMGMWADTFGLKDTDSSVASSCDESTLWVVVGKNHSSATIAPKLLEKSQSQNPNPTSSMATFLIDASKLPRFSEDASDESSHSGTPQAITKRIIRLLQNVQSVTGAQAPSDAQFKCSLHSESNIVRLTLDSGRTTTIGLAAALAGEIDAIRTRWRQERR
jgi:hypothetical protein